MRQWEKIQKMSRCIRHISKLSLILCGFLFLSWQVYALGHPTGHQHPTHPPKKIFIIIFENEDYEKVLEQPIFKTFADRGVLFENYFAITHPSYPNYLALTSGNTWNLWSDKQVDIDAVNIVDLLEQKGKTWKAYAEGYPGNCFLKKSFGNYFRKHVPFLSYKNIQNNPNRCARIVDEREFIKDFYAGTIPDYSFYVPDMIHDGHDSDMQTSAEWFENIFGRMLVDERFYKDLLLIVTFDESRLLSLENHIYTVFWGESVVSGLKTNVRYDHYDLLRTIEELFNLGTLGREDSKAKMIEGIWR